MEGGGEAPEPADRGGAGLPRRIDPEVPRRQRGYYIGGAGPDDAGYFVHAPEEAYGAAGADDAPAPEQVYGGAGRFVGEERISFRVPYPGGSPGRNGNLPLARGAAPPPLLLEDALARAPGSDGDMTRVRGGHQHGEVDAMGAEGRRGQAIRQLPVGGAGQGQQHRGNHRPQVEERRA